MLPFYICPFLAFLERKAVSIKQKLKNIIAGGRSWTFAPCPNFINLLEHKSWLIVWAFSQALKKQDLRVNIDVFARVLPMLALSCNPGLNKKLCLCEVISENALFYALAKVTKSINSFTKKRLVLYWHVLMHIGSMLQNWKSYFLLEKNKPEIWLRYIVV